MLMPWKKKNEDIVDLEGSSSGSIITAEDDNKDFQGWYHVRRISANIA